MWGRRGGFAPWAVFPCLQPRSLNSHSKLCTQAPRSSWRAGALCVAAVAVRLLHPLGAEFCSSSNLPVLHGLSYGSRAAHTSHQDGLENGGGGAQCSGSLSTLEEKCQQLPLPL